MTISRRSGFLVLLAPIFFCVSVGGCKRQETPRQVSKIGITYIVHHALLEEARQGFLDKLQSEGFVEGKNLAVYFQSAQGDSVAASQIVADFLGKGVDMIYTISTPSTKTAAQKTNDVPIVFSAVTDPQGAGIVMNLNHPGGNITGVSNFCPASEHVRFLHLVLPKATTVGIPYNPGEPSAASTVAIVEPAARNAGIKILTASVPNSAAAADAVASLIDKCDAIYIVPDNTMGAAIDVVADLCSRRGIPMLSSESATVRDGRALASLTTDHYKMGLDAGEMAIAILRGQKPGDIPIKLALHPLIHVSKSQAAKLGLTFLPEAESAFTFVK